MKLMMRFRSERYKTLVKSAVDQGFIQKVTGAGHLGIICPRCGTMTVFSGSQKDCTNYKYYNQETRLRKHGLIVEGKERKTCQANR